MTTSFDPARMTALNRLMDLFIPASRDGRMPAASSLSLYADLSGMPPKSLAALQRGLAELDARARAKHDCAFASLSTPDASSVVDELRRDDPAFVNTFTTQTTGRYLQHDAVMPLIGLEARPLWPQGNPVADGDWSLIDVVRKRPKIYREV